MCIKEGHTNVVVIFCITQPILNAEVDADSQFCHSLVFISLSVTEVVGAVSQSAARLVHLDVQKDTVTRSYRLTICHEIIFGNVV